ncbi:MAG TPA: hypothetical protein VFQ44_22325 [Streptosporangiaceae bacterium]|nr:hypothetical protein [Streptosporangiaceae bacterium]
MEFPAGGERGGEVFVAGAVDLLDPGAEPVDGFVARRAGQVPPAGWRLGCVALVMGCREGGGEVGELVPERGDLVVEAVECVHH